MSITDELRKWAHGPDEGDDWLDRIDEFCDRIDAEHESACAEAYGNGVMSVPIALDESAWVKLPVDADGVPIRPGDELVIFETGEHIRAYDIELYDDGRWRVCDEETMDSVCPDRLRHRAQTVEDVLREFAEKMNENMGMYTGEAIDADEWRDADRQTIAEFAKRLTLVGDDE